MSSKLKYIVLRTITSDPVKKNQDYSKVSAIVATHYFFGCKLNTLCEYTCLLVTWNFVKLDPIGVIVAKRSEDWNSETFVTHNWCTFHPIVLRSFWAIWFTCLKIACNSKKVDRRAKRSDIWDSTTPVTHNIRCTLDPVVFKVILGSFSSVYFVKMDYNSKTVGHIVQKLNEI